MVNVGVGVVSKGFGDLVRVDRCQCQLNYLTADAWVSGPDLAPQKILLSQKFRQLMRMRCLNFWDNKNFWGAKSSPLTHASAVKCLLNMENNIPIHYT